MRVKPCVKRGKNDAADAEAVREAVARLAEFGIVSPVGREGVERLLDALAREGADRLPAEVRASLAMLVERFEPAKRQILASDGRIRARGRARPGAAGG